MTKSTTRRFSTLLLGTALALTGCSTPSTGYTDLDRTPSAQDDFPTEIGTPDLIDADTVRFVTEDGDWSIWIGSGVNAENVCLVVYSTDQSWFSGCSGVVGGIEINAGGPGGAYGALPDGATLPDNAKLISENVYRIGAG
ncbi:MAG: hypothetical protein CMH34_09190 [Microbacterium sp.]|nr:hypothetical protein [Microbacterium sp.]|tara:strand:- start:571 stop:990 length:420 start_codon:yes stop_codon:yes gene_type:complete